MLGFLILASPLLAIIFWSSFRRWQYLDAADTEPKTLGRFFRAAFDSLFAFAGGVAFALVVGAFGVDDRYTATAIIAMIKGGVVVLIVAGLLTMLLRSLRGASHRFIVYGGVLLLVALYVSKGRPG